ncbi:hypothetical protein CBR64_17775 [Cellulosimicrobium cellulans]|uniref:Uncharacterized protein n=1 Tax=Cellulosimicrobium cellulans TaxID=1710 RepID=A0A1Y0HZP0_CELCE|nr:hypothetical protein [Cellulosimicrobium cellulans]ARU53006.1 hypothetical protein CBR64_17775 [Cellulosimicrobium cellulans]
MTDPQVADLVMTVLERGDYQRLPKPLIVAGMEFDFAAAARGTRRSHDLVLVATDRQPTLRLQRLLAGLARSLDLAQSRRPVTLVIIGELSANDRDDLERHARVLHVKSADPSEAEVERAIAVLLPLDLPAAVIIHGSDPINEVLATLGPGPDTAEHITLMRAAVEGADEVREALRSYVNAGVVTTSPGGVLDD